MPKLSRACLATAALLLTVAATTAALAQTTPAPVKVGGLWDSLQPYVVDVLGVIVTAAISWAAAAFTRRTGIEIDAKHREALHSAAMTGVNLALQRVGVAAHALDITTSSRVIDDAINWVIQSVPRRSSISARRRTRSVRWWRASSASCRRPA